MTDEERYNALKDRILENVPATTKLSKDIIEKIPEINSWEDLNKYFGQDKRLLIRKLAEEFGAVGKEYFNQDVQLSFEFSANNFRESYSKQGRNFVDFAKMFSVFDSIVENAVGVEVHKRSNYKPDPTLDAVFVLMSAYQDEDSVVPVKLEIKKFKDKQNALYVAISLEKIKKTEVWKQGNTENGVTQNSRSVNISISKIFEKINPSEKSFLKYIPDGFLSEAQRKGKQEALKEDAAKTKYGKNLTEAKKRAVTRTIEAAREADVNEAAIATFAEFSAKSGIVVSFDKSKRRENRMGFNAFFRDEFSVILQQKVFCGMLYHFKILLRFPQNSFTQKF